MFFKDHRGTAVMSSRDGKIMEATAVSAPDVIDSISVPGVSRKDIGDKVWTGVNTDYKGRKEGRHGFVTK
jgi:hypothetical protein